MQRLTWVGTDLGTGGITIKLEHVDDGGEMLDQKTERYTERYPWKRNISCQWLSEECDYCMLVHVILGPSLETPF